MTVQIVMRLLYRNYFWSLLESVQCDTQKFLHLIIEMRNFLVIDGVYWLVTDTMVTNQ